MLLYSVHVDVTVLLFQKSNQIMMWRYRRGGQMQDCYNLFALAYNNGITRDALTDQQALLIEGGHSKKYFYAHVKYASPNLQYKL